MISTVNTNPTLNIALKPFLSSLAQKGTTLAQKISQIAFPCFMASCALYLCVQGTYEIYTSRKKVINPSDSLLKQHYLPVHGTLILGTGISTSLDALHQFKWVNLGNLLKTIQNVGNFMFLYANVFALEENINLYESLHEKTSKQIEPSQQDRLLMRGAISGIISNLGYITATAVAAFGISTGLALVIGVISACFGSLKILFDYLAEQRASQEKPINL